MIPTTYRLALIAALVVFPGGVAGQDPAPPVADPSDVASIDAITAAVYESISGPAGQPGDWERFRSLFIPEARLIPSRLTPGGDGAYEQLVTTVGGYVRQFGGGL